MNNETNWEEMMRNNLFFTSNGIIGTNFSKEFIEKNIKDKKVIIIDNGTYSTSNYEKRQENIDKFYEYHAKSVNLVTISSENVNRILDYDICYVLGGSIANLVELIHCTNIKEVLKKFLEKGIYIGESSGSIILDEDVEWYFNLKRGTKQKYDRTFESYSGLGFMNHHIYPHYNKEKGEGIKKIREYQEEIYLLNDGEYREFYY